MSHFYAAIPISARRTVATARGHKATGISTYAASWAGKIETRLWHDEKTGQDCFDVVMLPHEGAGQSGIIAFGIVGDRSSINSYDGHIAA